MSDIFQVRLPQQLRASIEAATKARGMSSSAWLRKAATTCAVLEGIMFPDVRTDGKRRYARIVGGALVDVAYLHDVPTPADA